MEVAGAEPDLDDEEELKEIDGVSAVLVPTGSGRPSRKPLEEQKRRVCPHCSKVYTTNAGLRYHKPRCKGINEGGPKPKSKPKSKNDRPVRKRPAPKLLSSDESESEEEVELVATKSGRKVRRIKRREFTSTDLVDLGDESRSEESGEDEMSYQSDKAEEDEDNEEVKEEKEEGRAEEDAWGQKTYFLAPFRTELQEALEEAGDINTSSFGAVIASSEDGSSPVPMHSSGLARNATTSASPVRPLAVMEEQTDPPCPLMPGQEYMPPFFRTKPQTGEVQNRSQTVLSSLSPP